MISGGTGRGNGEQIVPVEWVREGPTQQLSSVESSALIASAVQILTEQWLVTQDEAFVAMQRHCQASDRTMSDLAAIIVASHRLSDR